MMISGGSGQKIKSIQRGKVQALPGAGVYESGSFFFTPVNPDKSVINLQACVAGGGFVSNNVEFSRAHRGARDSIVCWISGTDEASWERGAMVDDSGVSKLAPVTVVWEVIEYE